MTNKAQIELIDTKAQYSFTEELIQRIKINGNCRYCIGRKHTKETRCGKCQNLAKFLKENKTVQPVLF